MVFHLKWYDEREMKKKYLIFISCSSCDVNYASAFNDLLIRLGFHKEKIFFYQENGQGVDSEIRKEVFAAIKDSRFFIFFLSPGYCESQYCLQELGAAFATVGSSKIIPINLFQNVGETVYPGFLNASDMYYLLTKKDISPIFDKINNPKVVVLSLDKIDDFLDKVRDIKPNHPVKKIGEANVQTNTVSNRFSLPKSVSEIIICWYAVEYELSSFNIVNVTQYIAKNDLDIDESSIQDAAKRLNCRNVCQFDKYGSLAFNIDYFDFLVSKSNELNDSMTEILKKKVCSKEKIFAELIKSNDYVAIMCNYFLESSAKEEIAIEFSSSQSAKSNFQWWLEISYIKDSVSFYFEDTLKMLMKRGILYEDHRRECLVFSKSAEHLLRNLDQDTKDAIDQAMERSLI